VETESARPLTDADGLVAIVSIRDGVARVDVPDKDRVTLGRGLECDIVLPDPSVSRVHATIAGTSARYVEDAGSHNGTFLLGRRLAAGERAPLLVGATIGLGHVTVVLQRKSTEERLPPAVSEGARGVEAVVADPTMQRLHAMIDVIAPSALSVLLLGETGTGKEVFARAIHDRSPRAPAPFVALSCAAMPENMLEAELFGYERGAFTGAQQAKPGLLETANGGTAFLDEVGELTPTAQAKLLRALESGELMRLGSLKAKRVDVRVVAATNRDIQAMVGDGRFRADLFFRLNGFTLQIPPLRQRRSEILPLADLFARRAAANLERPAPRLTEATIAILERYDWPGNVRELRNVVERAVVLCLHGRALQPEHLMLPTPGSAPTASPGVPTLATLPPRAAGRDDAAEKDRIVATLQSTFGNQTEAARILGISRRALINKLAKHGIGRPRKGS
jgi:two-component system response regulator AtoC